MKVGINHTVEVTDDQRVKLADVIDGRQSKRQATRDEFKEYIWSEGEDWAMSLSGAWNNEFGEEELEDLLGEDDPLEDLL